MLQHEAPPRTIESQQHVGEHGKPEHTIQPPRILHLDHDDRHVLEARTAEPELGDDGLLYWTRTARTGSVDVQLPRRELQSGDLRASRRDERRRGAGIEQKPVWPMPIEMDVRDAQVVVPRHESDARSIQDRRARRCVGIECAGNERGEARHEQESENSGSETWRHETYGAWSGGSRFPLRRTAQPQP